MVRRYAGEGELELLHVLDSIVGVDAKRLVVAGVDDVGERHELLDRPVGHRFVPEDERVAPLDGDGAVLDGVAADDSEPVRRPGRDGDRASRVARRVDDLDTGEEHLALLDLVDATVEVLEDQVGPTRAGEVVRVGLLDVATLVPVHDDLCPWKDVEVLDVIPVRVGAHDDVDVRLDETARAQRCEQGSS